MNKKEFINKVKYELKLCGIKFEMPKVKNVYCDGIKCNGYFDDYTRTLKVARKSKQWFSILVHEYAHFLQFVNQCKVWRKIGKSSYMFDRWINKKVSLSPSDLNKYCKAVREVELDCERRSLALIKKYKLPINAKKYAQDANVYIMFYSYVKKYRKWSETNKRIFIKKVTDLMPKKLMHKSFYEKLPVKYEEYLNKYCFSEKRK